MKEKIPLLLKYFGPNVLTSFEIQETIQQYYFRFDKCYNFPECKKDIGH